MYNNIKPITELELSEYLKLYKTGHDEYRDKIIISCIPLVKYCVYKCFYASCKKDISYSYNDLTEVGMIGVMKALKYYDGRSNTKFSSFAFICIKSEILKFLKTRRKKLEFVSLDEIISFPSDIDLLNDYIEKELHDILKEKLSLFTPIEQEIILEAFGYNGEKTSYSKLSRKYSFSRAKIKKIVENSVLKLKEMLIEKNDNMIK